VVEGRITFVPIMVMSCQLSVVRMINSRSWERIHSGDCQVTEQYRFRAVNTTLLCSLISLHNVRGHYFLGSVTLERL
jgi:hypothetical protein